MQKTQERWVQSLGWEDPLGEEMATHSSIHVWKNPMKREAWQTQVHRIQEELDKTEGLSITRRLLRFPRRSNQLILKEINPEHSLEGLMLKLKLQYFGHMMQRADSLEKTLMLGKSEGKSTREWQRMRQLDNTINSLYLNLSKLREIVEDRGACSWSHKELNMMVIEQQQQQHIKNKQNVLYLCI